MRFGAVDGGHTGDVVERVKTGRASRVERIARNEAAFREANEQVELLNAAGARLPTIPVVCECGADDCLLVFEVDVDQYREVRENPARFLIQPGHEAPDVEAVVERHENFVVVQKNPGGPERLAQETAPQSREHSLDGEVALRIAENEARFRDANERIEEAVQRLEPTAVSLPFVCECGRPDCLKIMRLTIDEYESARAHPRYFLCAAGHEITGPDLGRVVRETSKYVLVEKIGDSGRVAEERDPRSN